MMEIPVRVSGNSRGVKNGGVLRIVTRKLRVKALPKNLPDFIDADITEMKIGAKMYITAVKARYILNPSYRQHGDLSSQNI